MFTRGTDTGMIKSHRGEIIAFDKSKRIGKVRVGNRTLRFSWANFASQLPTRFPEVGDPVEVLFSARKLLEVRALRQLPKRFNGKPIAHWQRTAKKLVVESLVRAAHSFQDDVSLGSLPREIASRRLMELAKIEDENLTREVLDERDRWYRNLARFHASIASR
ncbi:MAG: hypothetical protein Q6370_010715 [Candidatus Sigynarchaeota archaeon]|jgi:hypothetical protein